MRKPPRTARRSFEAAAVCLASAFLLAGFACEGSQPLTSAARDSGATGGAVGSPPDAPVTGSGGVSSGGAGGSTTSTGGPSGTGGASGTGGMGDSGSPSTGTAACGVQIPNPSRDPTDVLLVLDRSASMSYSIAEDCSCDTATASGSVPLCASTANCASRWASLTSALNTTLSNTPNIRWGLKLYTTPADSACGVSNGVEVPIGASSAAAVEAQIASVIPTGNTPTRAAITAATAYLETVSDISRKVILLATDGVPSCNPGEGSALGEDGRGTIVAITAAASAGFSVYVIGIGPSAGNLDNLAQAGGTGTAYPAASLADLGNALASISQAVMGCTYTLAAAPPDPNNVAVYVDKYLVLMDPTSGWSFGASSSTIVLNGSTCDKLTSGAASTVQVLFGCTGPPPMIIP